MKYSIRKQVLRFLIICGVLLTTYIPFFLLENQDMRSLIVENGPYQTLTAIAFIAAGVFLCMAFLATNNGNDFGKFKTRRNIFVIGLALVFFIGAGEELSWGQHMFGFEPPESIASINRQREFNLHNLFALADRNPDGTRKTGLQAWLTVGKAFSIFWLGYCTFIPLLAAFSANARSILTRVNIPIVPLWIGLAFPFNYVISKIIVSVTGTVDQYSAEVKETNFSLLFCLFSIVLYVSLKSRDAVSQRTVPVGQDH